MLRAMVWSPIGCDDVFSNQAKKTGLGTISVDYWAKVNEKNLTQMSQNTVGVAYHKEGSSID